METSPSMLHRQSAWRKIKLPWGQRCLPAAAAPVAEGAVHGGSSHLFGCLKVLQLKDSRHDMFPFVSLVLR